MKRILQTFLEQSLKNGTLLILGDNDEIIKILDDIKEEYLYKNEFHGLYHSQKVCFFAYLIGKHENLSDKDMRILLDAAKYHDIGRGDDHENDYHGFTGANLVDKFIEYDDPNDMYYLKAVIEAHSLPDSRKLSTFDNWVFQKLDDDEMLKRKTEDLEKERYLRICNILKDADVLDRYRFRNIPDTIDEKYFRVDYSKNLINLSRSINQYYIKFEIENKYNEVKSKYGETSYDKQICYHSVGFDLFKVISVLKHGVLSYYRAYKDKVKISRNFNGNNADFWISVVDADPNLKRRDAYQVYVKNAISFMCYVDHMIPGIQRARDNGSYLPRIPEDYPDEKFVFDKIPVEHIQFISIPREYMNASIMELQYLFCNSKYETVKNSVYNYLNEIESFCDIKINRKDFDEVLDAFREVQLEYNNTENHSDEDKKKYHQKLIHMKDQLNVYLQQMMQTAFSELMRRPASETITLADVMRYILHRNNIEYSIIDNNETIKDDFLEASQLNFHKDQDSFLLRLSTFDLNKDIYEDDDSESQRGM